MDVAHRLYPTIGRVTTTRKRLSQLHYDRFAAIVDERVPPAMLLAGLLAELVGCNVPRPCRITRHELVFFAPVSPGDELVFRLEVVAFDPRRARVELALTVRRDARQPVASGRAVVRLV